jgi:dihydrofolate reductase
MIPAMTLRPETCVFIATSLDGFIARPDGRLDWLMQAQGTAPPGEDFGYAAFMAGIDALVMGRKTLDTVRTFDPWPYAGTPVHVMTRQAPDDLPPLGELDVQWSRESPSALLDRLGGAGVRRVYLDGGELIQSFLREDRVDRITVTTVPVLIGQGRRLWGEVPTDLGWTLQEVRHWACGFVQATHQRERVRAPASAR